MMVGSENTLLEQLVESVLASRKYRHVNRDFVQDVGMRELVKGRSLKEAIKTTKNKLHQVSGAYLSREMPYGRWLDELREAAHSPAELHRTCRAIMRHHSSTRERLPILEQFYAATLNDLSPVNSVIDVACGLNPLAIPWMPLAEDASYYACDIYHDMIDFLNAFMELLPLQGRAESRDVIHDPPTNKANVAFILKSIPCIEQVDPSATLNLIERINANHLLISFPVRSLGGREKGMLASYQARFDKMAQDKSWMVKRFEFASELVFCVTT